MSLISKLKIHLNRRVRRVLIITAIALLAIVAADAIVGSIFRSRLAATIKHGTGADLTSRFAWYLPPRGVSLHHVRIAMPGKDGDGEELLTASRIVLKLAQLPKKGKPLVVSLLQIDSPAITIRAGTTPVPWPKPPAAKASVPGTPAPKAAATPLSQPAPGAQLASAAEKPVTASAASTPHPVAAAPDSAPKPPPSEKFEIRDFKITDGQITLDTGNDNPLVLEHIDLAFNPSAGSTGLYRFAADSDPNAPASIKGQGTVNVDDMTLGLSNITVAAKIGAILSQAHLSGAVKNRLEMARVDGMLNIHASAAIPMKDWRHSSYSADIELASAKAALPNNTVTVDSASGKFHIQDDGGQAPFTATLANFVAHSGASHLQIDGAKFTTLAGGSGWELSKILGDLDLAGDIPALQRCRLKGRFQFTAAASGLAHFPKNAGILAAVKHELLLYPRDVSVQPPLFPTPVDHINGGPISCRSGIIHFSNLLGNYGGDELLMEDGHITLDDPAHQVAFSDLRSQIRIEDISGTLICHQPGPQYPAGLGKVIAQLRPSGPFAIGGGSWYGINRWLPGETKKPKADYFFRVSTAGGAFALTDHKVPLTNIHADANISPMLVDIQNLRGNFVDGTLIGSTKITPVHPVVYSGTATFYNAHLQTAFRQIGATPKKPLKGVAYFKANFAGIGPGGPRPPRQTFAADGEFQVIDGNFGDIQTIRAAASNVSKPQQDLDGEAAGVFSVRDQTVTLENCAVGNPMFGLEGSGTIGFDKKLNLHAAAAPLGDWREGLKRSRVPVLEDVASDIAGSIQQLFASAQGTLLWDIHISGTTFAPKVEQTAVPAITRPAAAIFGQLIRGVKDNELLDQLRPPPAAGK